jgi:hypothetical protein
MNEKSEVRQDKLYINVDSVEQETDLHADDLTGSSEIENRSNASTFATVNSSYSTVVPFKQFKIRCRMSNSFA